ncbi:MAG: molecular chaperone TorD family protein [Candidatus Omnitrophica bacterium]|nr:molecular chaperone TorD family protein [Candidatus Omnitrophota bacterium]
MSDPTSTKTASELDRLFGRSYFYQMLAFAFRHPAEKGVREFFAENRRSWSQALHSLKMAGASGVRKNVGDLFRKTGRLSLEDWCGQYEHCFGFTAYAKVPAYELEYGEEHSHRQPQELADISSFYQAFGLRLNGRSRERPDHVSVECEFLYFLLYKQAYALAHHGPEKAEICARAAGRFAADHLGRWLPAFASRLEKRAGKTFLADAARAAAAFASWDCRIMGVESGRPDLPVRMVQESEEAGCVSCSLRK